MGSVVRVGNTVRRTRNAGSAVVEALLVHLADHGFDHAPRFLGIDDGGRQILQFVDGDVFRQPPWQLDDAANANALGHIAALLRELHEASRSFEPPAHAAPVRALPVPGSVWTHGDPGYPNIVYRGRDLHALIDWEFAAPGDPLVDPAALLGLSIRGPRPGADDAERRAVAARSALDALAAGYAMTNEQRACLPEFAAMVLDDAVAHWTDNAHISTQRLDAHRWRARWFREHGDWLLAPHR